jgi:uncharacterized membrane protein YdjX (TVP38/TMEM64 family)
MNWPKLQRIIFIVFIALIIGLFILFQILGYDIDSENIRQFVKDFGIWAPLIFIAVYIIGTFFIPATPFMLAAGILFGFKYGLIYTMISAGIGSTVVFYISRKLGKHWVEKILEHKYLTHLNEYNKKLEQGAIWDITILRIIPVMPFNALNVLLGISKAKIQDYIAGTLLGIIPSSVLTVYIGAFITKIF